MINQDSSINISRSSAFSYVNNIIYPKVSQLIAKEHLGKNQNCKFNHLQDYYYLIEILTNKKIDCIIENECLTYDKIKNVYDSFNLDCLIKCFACHNLPWKELLRFFDIDLKYIKQLENKYLIRYTIQLLQEDVIVSSTTQALGIKNQDYTLNIINPDEDIYEYLSLIIDNNRILPLVNSYTFVNLQCIHNVIAKFRLLGCLDAVPVTLILTPSLVTQTSMTVSWNNVGTNVSYRVELYKDAVLINTITTTNLTTNLTSLLPSSNYSVKVIATNCAGSVNSTIDLQTAPFLVVVEVINGTSTQSGNNTVAYGSSFLTNFTSTNPKTILSFTVNNISIPFNQLNITGTLLGQPQTGTYNLTNITSDKYIRIVYADYDVCSQVNMSYNSSNNTITIQ
jgi:hypothetical protein